MQRFLLICLGGAVGTGARYQLASWVARAYGPGVLGLLAARGLARFGPLLGSGG